MQILYPLFLKHIQSNQLVHPKDTVILGFSGGKDSVTLLHLLKHLQHDIPFRLVAAYFNHHIRPDAPGEEQWVRDYLDSLKVESAMGGKNIIHFKNQHKLNLEHAASISRYAFFSHLSSHYPNARIATAHTRSDLTETFFIKLFRGSGLQGLGTIHAKKENPDGNTIIRPLLLFDQQQVLDFLERNHLTFYHDNSNDDEAFLRNRIRKLLVPEAEKIEPDLHQRIFKTVSIIQDEYDYFSNRARQILAHHLLPGNILPPSLLNQHHTALQRHIVREFLRQLKGDLLNIDFRHIEAIRTQNTTTGGLAVPGVELSFHRGFIFPRDIPPTHYSHTLHAPGHLVIPEIDRRLKVKKITTFRKPKHNHTIILPLRPDTFPLLLRSPKPGDKYIKINSTIRQNVFEMIRASGIPAPLRHLCPVLTEGNQENQSPPIIWVAGSPIADAFGVKDKNQREFLRISITPL